MNHACQQHKHAQWSLQQHTCGDSNLAHFSLPKPKEFTVPWKQQAVVAGIDKTTSTQLNRKEIRTACAVR